MPFGILSQGDVVEVGPSVESYLIKPAPNSAAVARIM